MKYHLLIVCLAICFLGCSVGGDSKSVNSSQSQKQQSTSSSSQQPAKETLLAAKSGYKTKIVKRGMNAGAAPRPPANSKYQLVQYEAPVGPCAAYVTKDPGDGKRHPALIWITGGDNNSIGNVWGRQPRNNDQSISILKKGRIVGMFPSQRGGNNNPGKREGFFGEVDDILAAADYLEKLTYVDPDRIYLGGHSTGGTMVLMVAASTDRFRGIVSLGPVSSAGDYGGDYIYCSPNVKEEIRLRSPKFWLHCIKSPTYVLEGAQNGNWDSIDVMASDNMNPKVKFFRVSGHDHFSVIGPVMARLVGQIKKGELKVDSQMLRNLF